MQYYSLCMSSIWGGPVRLMLTFVLVFYHLVTANKCISVRLHRCIILTILSDLQQLFFCHCWTDSTVWYLWLSDILQCKGQGFTEPLMTRLLEKTNWSPDSAENNQPMITNKKSTAINILGADVQISWCRRLDLVNSFQMLAYTSKRFLL